VTRPKNCPGGRCDTPSHTPDKKGVERSMAPLVRHDSPLRIAVSMHSEVLKSDPILQQSKGAYDKLR
jgi:hypothetical protein